MEKSRKLSPIKLFVKKQFENDNESSINNFKYLKKGDGLGINFLTQIPT